MFPERKGNIIKRRRILTSFFLAALLDARVNGVIILNVLKEKHLNLEFFFLQCKSNQNSSFHNPKIYSEV